MSPQLARSLPLTRRGFVSWIAFAALASRLSAQQRPHRIVATSPSITETLFALGLGDQVVGAAQFSDFPPAAGKLPRVGSYIAPDVEAIARLTPDLVILERTSSELTGRLQALRIPFIQVPHVTLDDAFTAIDLIAKAAAVPERGTSLIDRIQRDLAAIKEKAKGLPSPRVLVIVDRRPAMLADMTALGPGNYLEQLLEIAGGTNVLANASIPPYPRISLETVLRNDPEVIIDLSGQRESEAERQALAQQTLSLWREHPQLAAVHRSEVVAAISTALLVPGPRAAEAAQRLFDYIHGGNSKGSAH